MHIKSGDSLLRSSVCLTWSTMWTNLSWSTPLRFYAQLLRCSGRLDAVGFLRACRGTSLIRKRTPPRITTGPQAPSPLFYSSSRDMYGPPNGPCRSISVYGPPTGPCVDQPLQRSSFCCTFHVQGYLAHRQPAPLPPPLPVCPTLFLQVYLARKKAPPPRTLPYAYAYGHTVVLGCPQENACPLGPQ